MSGLLSAMPGMPPTPPQNYIAFVARHLDALRREASAVAGERDADHVYPEVLSDVAARWRMFQVLSALGIKGSADRYLRATFQRRAQSWYPDDQWSGEVEVISQEDRPVWSSAALRSAAFTAPPPVARYEPNVEATIAWLHAYRARCRRLLLLRLAAALVVMALLARAHADAVAQAAGLLLLTGSPVTATGRLLLTGSPVTATGRQRPAAGPAGNRAGSTPRPGRPRRSPGAGSRDAGPPR